MTTINSDNSLISGKVNDSSYNSSTKTGNGKTPECLEDLKSGEWVNGFTLELGKCLYECEKLCFEFNSIPPSCKDKRQEILHRIFKTVGKNCVINPPFRCDFGSNISIGDNFTGNFNLTILDEADVVIGDNVFIGPNTSLCTVIHSLKPEERNNGIMCSHPIFIGNNVWIAANVVILPGVSVGEGAVVGAGSVVTKDVAPFTLVAGNPARVIKNIER